MKKLTKEQKLKIYCIKHGHAQFVTMDFGYVYCGRCNSHIGDTLGGSYDLTEKAIVGHDCEKCDAVVKTLSKSDLKIFKNLTKKGK